MATIFASISSNFFKKSIPLYASSTAINPLHFHKMPKHKLAIAQFGPQTCSSASFRANGISTYIPEKSPPEIPTAPPTHSPGIPPEMPRRQVPEFDPSPLETPEPGPEFPGPPDPMPEAPPPPEVIPPHGPEITPKPGPTQPDIPPPIMGSNGLAFY